jgi:predicted aspartyl protease
MGHVFVDIVVKGSRGEEKLEKVLVDTGASYTVLDLDIVERVSAWRIPFRISLELGDGRVVEAETYAAIVCIGDRCAPTLVASFRGAKNVVGVRTLEDLGLAVDPVSKRLVPVRPPNTAYFYTLQSS